jgi:hypothetical protein
MNAFLRGEREPMLRNSASGKTLFGWALPCACFCLFLRPFPGANPSGICPESGLHRRNPNLLVPVQYTLVPVLDFNYRPHDPNIDHRVLVPVWALTIGHGTSIHTQKKKRIAIAPLEPLAPNSPPLPTGAARGLAARSAWPLSDCFFSLFLLLSLDRIKKLGGAKS